VWKRRISPNRSYSPERNPVCPQVGHDIPAGRLLFRLDETIGRERIYVVATRPPARDLEDLMERARKEVHPHREMVLQIQTRGVGGVVGPGDAQPLTRDDDVALKVLKFEHRPRVP